jgi:hypothetical protein
MIAGNKHHFAHVHKGFHTIGGQRYFFKSKWEVNVAHWLQWMTELGIIAGWLYEPRTFWFEKIKRGVRSYTPDFRIDENDGTETFVEVKGYMDPESKTKLKRMAKYFPTVKLDLFDTDVYKIIKNMAGLVPGWID